MALGMALAKVTVILGEMMMGLMLMILVNPGVLGAQMDGDCRNLWNVNIDNEDYYLWCFIMQVSINDNFIS